MYTLQDAEEAHASNPDTFQIPEQQRRKSLKKGDIAKLIFLQEESGERMWVEIIEVVKESGAYLGTLANDPILTEGLEWSDEVLFEPRHVINIWEES